MTQDERDFEALLEYLKRIRGFDFTGYKRPSLARRVEKRMRVVGAADFAAYQVFLERHPQEFASLCNTILINVTAFFRDEAAWAFLADAVIPGLLKTRAQGAPIRAWSAGCASGEEAYTLAMLLAEAVGCEAFRDRVTIHATDVDDDALARARAGVYSRQDVTAVPEQLRMRYFDLADERFSVREELRRQVIFTRHDIVNDAPISRIDLLACRNTLMYLNAETQSKTIARLHAALNPDGVLFLGRAETLLAYTATFEPIDLKRRISRKVVRDAATSSWSGRG